MRPTVKIAFDLSLAGTGDFFTLNDPVKGELNDGPFGLGGEVLTDVTADVRSVTLRRGRSSETQTIDAGTANVVLDNRLRLYDPLADSTVSPYAPSILPRKELTIDLGPDRVFTGQVEDWDLQYAIGGDSVTVAKVADGFALLSQYAFSASAVTASGATGAIIGDTASVGGWFPGRTDLDVGTVNVGPVELAEDAGVLGKLQEITASEGGLLFIDRLGLLAFRDRNSSFLRTDVLFTDSGPGFRFFAIEIEYGTEFLFTRVEVEWVGATKVAAEDLAASELYGLQSYRVKTQIASEEEAEDFAAFLVDRYRQPTVRVRGLSVQMNTLSAADQRRLNQLDLGSIVFVRFTPNGIGKPIFAELAIEEIEHVISPEDHVLRFKLFEPLLRREFGSVFGSSVSSGTVLGVKGKGGVVFGSSVSSGTVEGTDAFVLDFSRLDEGYLFTRFGSLTGVSVSSGTVTGVGGLYLLLDAGKLGENVLG